MWHRYNTQFANDFDSLFNLSAFWGCVPSPGWSLTSALRSIWRELGGRAVIWQLMSEGDLVPCHWPPPHCHAVLDPSWAACVALCHSSQLWFLLIISGTKGPYRWPSRPEQAAWPGSSECQSASAAAVCLLCHERKDKVDLHLSLKAGCSSDQSDWI